MRALASVLALAVALATSPANAADPSPLEAARTQLAAGQFDAVFESLETHPFLDSEKPAAADLMADAALKCLESGDATLALHFSQLALRTQKKHPRGLEIAARTCRVQQEFSAAERYADEWRKVAPKDADATLLRAEIAWDQGEWQRVLDLVKPLGKGLSLAQKQRLLALQSSAHDELAQRAQGLTALKAVDEQVKRGNGTVRGKVPTAEAPPIVSATTGSNAITLYGTSWCGYCRKARDYLRKKGVAFTDRDIEADPAARAELDTKAEKVGMHVSGVPVIDVRGNLVLGFDQAELERLLR